jgi:hypothetical protein
MFDIIPDKMKNIKYIPQGQAGGLLLIVKTHLVQAKGHYEPAKGP